MNKHRTHLAQTMSYTNVRVHNSLMHKIEAEKTGWQSTTAIVNDLISSAIDARNKLDGATEPASGQHSLGRSPSKSSSLNKRDKDVPKSEKEIPGNLFPHEDLIRSFWKAKGGKKSDYAWTRQMNQLTKLQELYGDQVVIAQLEEGRAKGWESVEVRKYEQFGLNKPNTATQASGIDYEALDAIRTPW